MPELPEAGRLRGRRLTLRPGTGSIKAVRIFYRLVAVAALAAAFAAVAYASPPPVTVTAPEGVTTISAPTLAHWVRIARHEGPGGVTIAAPLERLPLLVRAGAILPLGPVVQHTDERPLDELTLQIYPEGTSRFELYEDDGRSNAYRRGHHALTTHEDT